MSRRKNYFLPVSLDVHALSQVQTGDPDIPFPTDKVCLLFTAISQDRIRLKQRNEPDGYMQIHRDTLFDLFNNPYRTVLDSLLGNGLLEVDQVDLETGEVYEKGAYSKAAGKARAYRFPDHLRHPDKLFKRVPMPLNNKVLNNTLDRLNRVSTDPQILADHYRQTILTNTQKLVLLDNEETRAIIRAESERRGVSYTEDLAQAIIAEFNDSPLHQPVFCEFAGRLHAPFMRKAKAYRPQFRFAEYPDEPTVELDMVASQPWFLSIITPALIKKFVPECRDAIPFFKAVQHEPDYLQFRELCQNAEPGQGIYDHLAQLWNKTYGDRFTRNDAKKICYRAFFSNYAMNETKSISKRERSLRRYGKLHTAAEQKLNVAALMGTIDEQEAALEACDILKVKVKQAESRLFTQKCFELFRAEFPATYRLFKNIKELRWDFPRGNKGKVKYYANNALLAQRLEANIVFGVVVKALLDANIRYVVTIHDAFLIRKRDEAKARKVIKKAFNSIGLKPNLKPSTP